MLRLTELKLPLDHAEGAVEAALLKRLGIAAQDLIGFAVFRRGVDARKKSAIALIYTLDIEVTDEKAVLRRLKGDRNVSVAPDMSYRFVALGHNTVRGAAGASILNAELMHAELQCLS